jgi:hypothetical protein
MKDTERIILTSILIVCVILQLIYSQVIETEKRKGSAYQENQNLIIVELTFIDSGVSPFSGYRWRDIAGNLYADDYRTNYRYDDTDVQVQVTFEESDVTFHGQMSAVHLKPNFAYQLKINGIPGTASNEWIGLAGRWWQEEWDGSQWTGGQNLNNKGDGSSPNPNDEVYFARRDEPDTTSPTRLNYRYTGYLLFDYFITDANGDALLDFEANSSYHVLWNTYQRSHTANDGPTKSATFDPDPDQLAYDTDYSSSSMTIFGEWERLPVGEVYITPGEYICQIILTEESFHGWPGGSYTGQWAAALGADIQFTVEDDVQLAIQLVSFDAESANSCVMLRWVTESEINHAGFGISRSSQKEEAYSSITNFRNNPELKGQGNCSERREYFYTDCEVFAGRSYWYYLVDITLDGHRTYYGPVQVYVTDNGGLKYLSSHTSQKLMLYPNFPNPFNLSTRIRFDFPLINHSRKAVTLEIFNLNGQRVRLLYQGEITDGLFETVWDGKSEDGSPAASGIYFIVLRTPEIFKTGKMILLQ